MMETVRILGIDPGSQITGYGIVDIVGKRTVPVHWGSVHTKGEHSDRLRTIFTAMSGLVQQYRPAEIAIERVFLSRNADSALKLGQARAAALCGTFVMEMTVHEYSARHVKKAVAGNGGAEKTQVQEMVRMLLGIRETVQADAADALAVAICHAHERDARSAIHAALAQA
jgi:crossover junction endodeoxyribonuclease RuvC